MKARFIYWSGFSILSVCCLLLSSCQSNPELSQTNKIVRPIRSIPQVKQDVLLKRQIQQKLYQADTALNNTEVRVESIYGSVLLTGRVPSLKLKKIVEARARSVKNVDVIHNYITVGSSYTNAERQADASLEEQIDLLLKDRIRLKNLDYYVVVRDKTIFIMGRLSKKELEIVIQQLQALTGARKVVSLVDFI